MDPEYWMKTDSWIPFFKLDPEGNECMAQQTYEPLLNPEGTVFCANYDWKNKYQKLEDADRPLYTEEAVDYFFRKEVDYISKYQDRDYMPEVLEIDLDTKQIFFRWHGKSCNHIIYSGGNLDDCCFNWRDQIKNIELDLFISGTYKLTMYPHCHFIDSDGKMKAIDWYGCIPVDDYWVLSKWMDSIIHHTAKFRLEETGDIVDGKYNLKRMFKGSMGKHVTWGKQDMKYIYRQIFGQDPL